jgi:hypothetical protein
MRTNKKTKHELSLSLLAQIVQKWQLVEDKASKTVILQSFTFNIQNSTAFGREKIVANLLSAA